jgi:hypothetical protein
LLRPLHWSERQRSTLWTSGRELESNKARLTWLQLRQLNEPEQRSCRRFAHSGGHPSPLADVAQRVNLGGDRKQQNRPM